MSRYHVSHLDVGMQDVARKIMSFAQVGPRAVCIISANGVISNVTLRQQSTSGGTVTYQVSRLNCNSCLLLFLLMTNRKQALYDKRLHSSLHSGYRKSVSVSPP